MDDEEKVIEAIQVARLYYYQGLTTEAIAKELNVSRSTVSRLLTYAKQVGLVNISIIDPHSLPQKNEKEIMAKFGLKKVHVVPVPDNVSELVWLDRVAQYTGKYLNAKISSNMILGVAWGTTLSAVSKHLSPKVTQNSQIIQLNGAGNTQEMGIEYASEIIMRFARNYRMRAHLFPVPTFFDDPRTKQALWNERSIKRLLDLREHADLLLFSIGAVDAGIPSHVYSGGYLEDKDYLVLNKELIAGDIATVFFRDNGSFDGIAINDQASGPELGFFQNKYGICVVSGLGKMKGLNAALKGGLIKELIIDQPSANHLVERYINHKTE